MTSPTDNIAASPIGTSSQDSISSIGQLIEQISGWFNAHYPEILLALAVGAIIFILLVGSKHLAARYVRNNENLTGYRAILVGAIAKTNKFFMVMASAELVASFSNAPEPVDDTIHILFIIAAALQGAIWLREIILGIILRRTSRDPDQHETLQNAMTLIRLLVTVVLFSIAAIVILDNLGVDVTGLVAGLGIGGIAIGLAAQGIFSDLFAALSIIFDKPFRRGETISFDNITGTIEKIGLKSTRLRAITGEEIIISNTNLLDKELINQTRLARRRTRFEIGVVYQTAPEQARAIPAMLKKIVEDNDAKFIRSGFVGFGDSSINFELDFDIMSSDYEVVYAGRHKIGLAILEKFNDEGLEFAYPTQLNIDAESADSLGSPVPK